MQYNKENIQGFSMTSSNQQDDKPNPLLALAMENKWETSWDDTLKGLVIECAFDFPSISSRMNQAFQTSAFTPDICQKHWTDLHKQRKQKKTTNATNEETDQDKMNRIMKLSAPPVEGARKRMTLQELEESLPKTRNKTDFLDPTTIREFDREIDTTITGEKIKPSGFNILKDRIRPTAEEQKLREDDFLKNLDKIASEFNEADNENPFVFKANFDPAGDFNLERLAFDSEEAKKRLEEQVDLTQYRSIQKEFVQEFPKRPEIEVERNNEEIKAPSLLPAHAEEGLKFERIHGGSDEEDEEDDNFTNLLNKPFDMKGAINALEKLEENVTQQKQKFYLEEDEETLVIPEGVAAQLDVNPQNMYKELYNPWMEPEPVQEKPVIVKEKKEKAVSFVEKPVVEKKLEEVAPVISKPVVEQKPKEKTEEELEAEEQARKAKLFESFKAREVQDFEGSDVSEEELEDQRKKIAKEAKIVDEFSKQVEDQQNVDETAEKEKVEETKRTEEELKHQAEVEEKIAEERLKRLIEASFGMKKDTEVKKVVKPAPEEEVNEPEEEIDEEEKRKNLKRQKKMEEHGRKLAELMREVNKRNDEYEKQKDEEEKKLQEEEEQRAVREQQEKQKEAEDNLKNAWTNSYVGSLFDEKVSYLKSVSALPKIISQHLEGKHLVTERERLLGRYQMLCLPILGSQNEYIGALLEYFMKFSSFNVKPVEHQNPDISEVFPFKVIATGIFSRFEGKGKADIERAVNRGELIDYFYLVFDTFEGRGNQILEEVSKSVILESIFGNTGVKKIYEELNQNEETTLVLKDISIFHYKNLEMIDEVFNTKPAMSGICLGETEDPKANEYEAAVVLLPFSEKEKPTEHVKERGLWRSNVRSFLKKASKENLQLIGLKSIYMTQEDLDNFKYKVGTLPISTPQPLMALVIGGYRAVEKVKIIAGSADVTIAKKLEPKSINAKYGSSGSHKINILCSPNNSHAAKRWLSFFFGGRASSRSWFSSQENQVAEKFRKDPLNYQIITRPIKRVMLLVSSKMGNRRLPQLLSELIDKGFNINEIQMFTRNLMKQHLEHSDKVVNEKFAGLANRLDLNCFRFFCDTTQNPCNFLLSLKGSEPDFLNRFLPEFLFAKDSTQPTHLIKVIEDQSDIDLLHKVFFQNRVKYNSPELTRGRNMRHYLLLRPLENLHDMQSGCEDLDGLTAQGLELIGAEVFHANRLHPVRTLLENGLVQSIRVSNTSKKRKEFSNFITKVADYIEHNLLFAAILRLQDPLKTTEDLGKLPVLVNSNFYIPETMVFNFGRAESKTPISRDLFEKLLIEYNMDDIVELAEKISIGLGDDRTLNDSFIYDLPPRIDGVVQSDLVSTVLMIAKSTMGLTSLNFVTKFFEQNGFIIQRLSLLNMPSEIINQVQYNYSYYSPEEIEKWAVLKEKMSAEPFWTFVLTKYNAIFECKNMVYELLKKIHACGRDSYSKQVSQKDLAYLYGVYFCRSFEDAKRDLETLETVYREKKNLLSENKEELVSTMEHVQSGSATTESGLIIFRNKGGLEKQAIHEFLDMFHDLKIRVINFKAVEGFVEEDKEALVEIFKFKHNEEALRAFLASGVDNYYILSVEYKLGSTLNELVGSFRMKSLEENAEFSKGYLIKKYGHEFLYTSNFQEVQKLTPRFFGVIDSDHFKLI